MMPARRWRGHAGHTRRSPDARPAGAPPTMLFMTDPDPRAVFAAMTRALITEFRANGGHVTNGPFAGRPVLLLTTTGAKSGQPRLAPVVYSRDGEHYVIVASKAGAADPSGLVPQPPREPGRDRGGRERDVHVTGEGDGGGGARAAVRGARRHQSEVRRVPATDDSHDPRGRAGAHQLGSTNRIRRRRRHRETRWLTRRRSRGRVRRTGRRCNRWGGGGAAVRGAVPPVGASSSTQKPCGEDGPRNPRGGCLSSRAWS